MKKTINKEYVEGRVYSHNLALKTVQNTASENYGKEFINGTLDVATDDECLNVVTVNFTYVTPTTKAGTENKTYTALKRILDGGKTVSVDGADAATKVKVSTSLAVNDFYTNRNGQEELVSAKRNDGGFVTIVNELCDENATDRVGTPLRNGFSVDMLINGTKFVEANEERHIPQDYLEVKGCVFNFRGELQPVTLVCKNPAGISYFESLEASSNNVTFTNIKGWINNTAIEIKSEEEAAFGEPTVVTYTRNIKEWVIKTAAKETYEIDDPENGITKEEIATAIANRNTYLADVKRRQDEYQATKNAAPTAPKTGTTAATGSFDF